MRQRGSVTLFIIVGVILTLIALGVLFGVKRLAMNDQTPPMVVSTQDENKPNSEEPKPESGQSDKQKEDKSNSNSQNNQGSSDDKDNTSQPEGQKDNNSVADTGSQNSGSRGVNGNSQPAESSSRARVESQTHEDLPQSGPKENLAAFALTALTVSSVAYLRSLRHL